MQEVESMHAAFLIFGLTQVAQSCFFVCILSIVFYSVHLYFRITIFVFNNIIILLFREFVYIKW